MFVKTSSQIETTEGFTAQIINYITKMDTVLRKIDNVPARHNFHSCLFNLHQMQNLFNHKQFNYSYAALSTLPPHSTM